MLRVTQCEAMDGPPYAQCRKRARRMRRRPSGSYMRVCDRHALVFDMVKRARRWCDR